MRQHRKGYVCNDVKGNHCTSQIYQRGHMVCKIRFTEPVFKRLVVGISEPVLLLLTLPKLKCDGVARPSPIHLEGQLEKVRFFVM
jgi:hypothetical protein